MTKYITFKEKLTFEQRLNESINIRNRFYGRIPVIVEVALNASRDLPIIDKSKFLVPGDLTLGQFIFIIRRRLVLPSEKALFVFVNNNLPLTSDLMREIYGNYRDNDGFLYLNYTSENTFGCKNYF
jgi:GABA(A) receptor-associated protein|uniref:Autophagy-related protein n=1 Tax=viral metagenome TaxID=1070528 RepID=A0A6C0GZC3_9ZZZZ